MTAAEVARKAADLLERDGWCQGRLVGNKGDHCILGALDAVDPSEDARFLKATSDFILRVKGAVTLWNDAPERTANEVIALLRQVATELEGS